MRFGNFFIGSMVANRALLGLSVFAATAAAFSSIVPINADTSSLPPANCVYPSVNNVQNNQFCTCPYTEYTLTPENSGSCQETSCSPQGQKAHHLETRLKYCTCDEPGHQGITFLPNNTTNCPASDPVNVYSVSIFNVSVIDTYDTVRILLSKNPGIASQIEYNIYKNGSFVGNGSTPPATGQFITISNFRSVLNGYGGAGTYRMDFASCPISTQPAGIRSDCGPTYSVTMFYVPQVSPASASSSLSSASVVQSSVPVSSNASSVLWIDTSSSQTSVVSSSSVAAGPHNPASVTLSSVTVDEEFDAILVGSSIKDRIPSQIQYNIYKNGALVGVGGTGPFFGQKIYIQHLHSILNNAGGAGTYRIDIASCPVSINTQAFGIKSECGPTYSIPYTWSLNSSAPAIAAHCISPAFLNKENNQFCTCPDGETIVSGANCPIAHCISPAVLNRENNQFCTCPNGETIVSDGICAPDQHKSSSNTSSVSSKKSSASSKPAAGGCIAPAVVSATDHSRCWCPAKKGYVLNQGDPSCIVEAAAQCIAPAYDRGDGVLCVCPTTPQRLLLKGDASCNGGCMFPAVPNTGAPGWCTCPSAQPYTIAKGDTSCVVGPKGCIAPAYPIANSPGFCTCPMPVNPYTIKEGDASCKAVQGCIAPAYPIANSPGFCTCPSTHETILEGDSSCKGPLICDPPAITDPINANSCICPATDKRDAYSLAKGDASCVADGPGCLYPAVLETDPKKAGLCKCGSGDIKQGVACHIYNYYCPSPSKPIGYNICNCPLEIFPPFTFNITDSNASASISRCKMEWGWEHPTSSAGSANNSNGGNSSANNSNGGNSSANHSSAASSANNSNGASSSKTVTSSANNSKSASAHSSSASSSSINIWADWCISKFKYTIVHFTGNPDYYYFLGGGLQLYDVKDHTFQSNIDDYPNQYRDIGPYNQSAIASYITYLNGPIGGEGMTNNTILSCAHYPHSGMTYTVTGAGPRLIVGNGPPPG